MERSCFFANPADTVFKCIFYGSISSSSFNTRRVCIEKRPFSLRYIIFTLTQKTTAAASNSRAYLYTWQCDDDDDDDDEITAMTVCWPATGYVTRFGYRRRRAACCTTAAEKDERERNELATTAAGPPRSSTSISSSSKNDGNSYNKSIHTQTARNKLFHIIFYV